MAHSACPAWGYSGGLYQGGSQMGFPMNAPKGPWDGGRQFSTSPWYRHAWEDGDRLVPKEAKQQEEGQANGGKRTNSGGGEEAAPKSAGRGRGGRRGGGGGKAQGRGGGGNDRGEGGWWSKESSWSDGWWSSDGGGWDGGKDSASEWSEGRGGVPYNFHYQAFLGKWNDSLGHEVSVERGVDRRGPLFTRLVRGEKERTLSLRRDPESGCWACGNAVLDIQSSSPSTLIWVDVSSNRRSVWQRPSSGSEGEAGASQELPDLLPWLLIEPHHGVQIRKVGQRGGKGKSKGKAAEGEPTEASAKAKVAPLKFEMFDQAEEHTIGTSPQLFPTSRTLAMDSSVVNAASTGHARKRNDTSGSGRDRGYTGSSTASCLTDSPGMSPLNLGRPTSISELPEALLPATEADEGAAMMRDALSISAVLDARQVLGGDRAAQETLCHILMDYDLLRGAPGSGDDLMVPPCRSPLWERLADAPRRNVLQRLASLENNGSAGSAGDSGCRIEAAAPDLSVVHVGRHRFFPAATDIQALRRRWTPPTTGGGASALFDAGSCAMASAHVLALYRTLENPLLPEPQRGSLQLAWDPAERKKAGIEYELFASPMNAIVENGHYASRWPHVEAAFGSAGSYPSVIDVFPQGASVCVNPPFTEGYLEHMMGPTLDRLIEHFQLHLFVPVRDTPWRSQLARFTGATFIRQFWDASSLKARPMGNPVLYWHSGQP